MCGAPTQMVSCLETRPPWAGPLTPCPTAAGPYSEGTLLQHADGLVVEAGELHRHLVIDRQQQLLPGLQLALQVLAVLVREPWCSCGQGHKPGFVARACTGIPIIPPN